MSKGECFQGQWTSGVSRLLILHAVCVLMMMKELQVPAELAERSAECAT